MNEREFIESIRKQRLELEMSNLIHLNEYNEFTYDSMEIKNKQSVITRSAIVNLVENYSFSKDFQISGIWFKKKIKENKSYVYFGKLDEDDLVEDKLGDTIKLIEFNSSHIMAECAEKSESFLEVLSYLSACRIQNILKGKTGYSDAELTNMRKIATSLAGGDKYKEFYEWFIA